MGGKGNSSETAENRRLLVAMARDNIAHVVAGNAPSQTDAVLRVPAEHYLDGDRWRREVAMFKRFSVHG